MESHHRVSRTLAALVVTGALAGCVSGTEAVPIPGADDVVTAPPAPVDPSDAESAITETTPIEPTTPTATTVAAPAATPVPEASTTAPPPIDTAAPSAPEEPPATDDDDDVFLRLGDEGPEVAVMQRKLAVLDYLPDGSDTGVFDEATRSGLRRFQGDYGLGVDGVFGPLTGRSLNAAVQSVSVDA